MKVGDYIHFHASNYLKYGLSVDKQQTVNSMAVLQQQKKIILKKTLTHYGNKQKRNIKQQLEYQLNFYFNAHDRNKLTLGYTPEEQAEIIKKMEEICEKAAQSIDPTAFSDNTVSNMATLHAVGSSKNVDVSSMSGTFSKHRDNATLGQKNTTTSAVVKRMNDLLTLRDKLAGKYWQSDGINSEIIDDITNLNRMYNELLADDMLLAETAAGGANHTWNLTKGNAVFLQELQRIIDKTKQDTASQVKGILGEVTPVFSQMVANYVANNGINGLMDYLTKGLNSGYFVDVLRRKVVGQKESVKILRSDKVMDKKQKNAESVLQQVQAQVRDTPFSVKATQDKVDVILDLPEEQTINTSVKNVNLFSGHNINLLSGGKNGQNLLNFVQDYPTFANHYFNLMANVGRHDPFAGSILQQAHEVMKLTIALKALAGGVQAADSSGNTFKTQQAELFIVNNSSASTKLGQYKVYFISDLINMIANDIEGWITIEGLPSSYENKWIDSGVGGLYKCHRCEGPSMKHALARSANILKQAKSQALTVSMNPKYFRQ